MSRSRYIGKSIIQLVDSDETTDILYVPDMYYHLAEKGTNFGTPFDPNVIAEPGQQEYTTAGSYVWTVPAGVTSVCVLCIGGGGGGAGYFGQAGAGGGLAYKNDIAVTPGTTHNITVGAGGAGMPYTNLTNVAPGSQSTYNGKSSSALGVIATGGDHGGALSYSGGFSNQSGGTYTTGLYDGGGVGGVCEGNYSSNSGSSTYNSSGGGGAGGYSGNGGRGAGSAANNGVLVGALSGSGGGGGGGGSRPVRTSNSYGGAGGGGVGIYGEGSNGAGGVTNTATAANVQVNITVAGGGGSSGSTGNVSLTTVGTGGAGGLYGGGGGSGHSSQSSVGGAGARGAVRIIWGDGRAYPSTNTADV